jgi:hypothetical protein
VYFLVDSAREFCLIDNIMYVFLHKKNHIFGAEDNKKSGTHVPLFLT